MYAPAGPIVEIVARVGGRLCHIAANIFARGLVGTKTDGTKQTEGLHRNQQQFRVFADSIPELCWNGTSGRPHILVRRAL
jgi:hypothetical protein